GPGPRRLGGGAGRALHLRRGRRRPERRGARPLRLRLPGVRAPDPPEQRYSGRDHLQPLPGRERPLELRHARALLPRPGRGRMTRTTRMTRTMRRMDLGLPSGGCDPPFPAAVWVNTNAADG